MPKADDFDMLLSTVFEVTDAAEWKSALAVLLRKHGEHFVVVPKLVAVTVYALFGTLNFQALIVLGNLAVPLVAGLLYALFAPFTGRALWCALPALLPLAVPIFYQAALWACAVLEHLWVMVFVVAALLCELRPTRTVRGAQCILVLLASSTQGNGFLIAPILALLRLYRRDFIGAALFGAFSLCAVLLHLESLPHATSAGITATISLESILVYTLSFLGSSITTHRLAAPCAGAAYLLCNLALLFNHRDERTRLLLACALFVSLTAGVNALARAHLGVQYPLTQSRYAYPAAIGVAATVLALIRAVEQSTLRTNLRRAVLCALSLASAALWCASWLRVQPWLQLYANTTTNSAAHWRSSRTGLEYPDHSRASALLTRLEQEGLFSAPQALALLEPRPLTPCLPADEQAGPSPRGPQVVVEHYAEGPTGITISGYVVGRTERGALETMELVAYTPTGACAWRTTPILQPRPDVTNPSPTRTRPGLGFFAYVEPPRRDVGSGRQSATFNLKAAVNGGQRGTGAQELK
jgi:hypothetical protein